MSVRRVIIMGAAGRDFHNFNTVYRDNASYRVVAFTATQIPDIAGRRYPAALAGSLYPEGIPIHAESELPQLVADHRVDEVVFAYSDVSHEYVMHQACTAMAVGADFTLLGPTHTCIRASVPVVAVCAVRTGVGKSQTTRRVAEILKRAGVRIAVIRHPMPYGDLAAQAVQRFASAADLDRYQCTIEEREEYAPHLDRGNLVFAGVDYERIMREACREADIILWDGGNNDYPFYVPDVHLTLVDPHRLGHETSYFPGELNLRMAHAVIINKVDSAPAEAVQQLRRTIERINPNAAIVEANSPIRVDDGESLRGRRALVVEDGPTLTHGEMSFGAGILAAERYGATVVDPRPYAVGSIKAVFERWTHLGPVLPAMGYSEVQRDELSRTIAATPADVVIVGTPIDLAQIVAIDKPSVRVYYDLEERSGPPLAELLAPVLRSVAASKG